MTVCFEIIQIQSITVVINSLRTRAKLEDIMFVGHIVNNTYIFA
jgi:hypothetical protein